MKAIVITMMLLLVGITLIALPACDFGQGATESPPTTPQPDQGYTELPPPPPPPARPEHWHPKLESDLNQLVDAEEQGNTEILAMAANLGLTTDEGVRVAIACEPGQAEAVAEVAVKLGAKVVCIYHDDIDAFVPINKLTTLADEESIRSIRLPVYAAPMGD
jgi:L-aminopeptidase/D-esterase-like protein